MSLTTTLILMGFGLAVFGFSAWRTSLPWNPLKGPRLIPWQTIAIFSAVFTIFVGVHILTLFGIESGPQF